MQGEQNSLRMLAKLARDSTTSCDWQSFVSKYVLVFSFSITHVHSYSYRQRGQARSSLWPGCVQARAFGSSPKQSELILTLDAGYPQTD